MTPHEVHHRRRPNPDHWETIPLLLGVAAVVLVGILVLANGI